METVVKQDLQKRSFRIGGMTCVNCQNRIVKKLKSTAGVHDAAVDYSTGDASVTYDADVVGFDEIKAAVEKLGYKTLEGEKAAFQGEAWLKIAGTLVVILALFMLMQTFTTSKLAAAFPLAQEGMSYGMLLVIGLLTSVHCIAMCGGINLSQTLRKNGGVGNRESGIGSRESGDEGFALTGAYSLLLPSILYNGGRLVSYTAVGVLVGALGSAITLTGRFKGAVQIAAGVFMVIMGLNMLGLFPILRRLSLPKFFAGKTDGLKTGRTLVRRGPLVVGFLNGFMPCGPLQAMQLYALSTGSPVRGGISMFLFCAGTIPLMFALGAASGALSGAKGLAFSRRVMQAGAVLVAALGLVMFSNGWNLSGSQRPSDKTAPSKPISRVAVGGSGSDSDFSPLSPPVPPASSPSASSSPSPPVSSPPSPPVSSPPGPPNPVIQNGAQIVNSTLRSNRYPAITVQQGIPVRWTINAPPGSITGCNNRMFIREYGIEHAFEQGDNVIEFTPARTGRFRYSCWMGMIQSSITVLAEAGKEDK